MGGFPVLSLLLLLPVAGAVLAWLWPRPEGARAVAAGTSATVLAVALAAVAGFDGANPGFQHLERASWIPSLNIHYLVGVDCISLLFLPFSAVLFLGAVLTSCNSVRSLPRLYFSLLLLALAATLGVLVALDTILFFLFWELSLVPVELTVK